MKRFHNISALVILCAASLLAQIPKVVSPEVSDDKTATFRVYAPKAEKVLLLGDWLKQGVQHEMTKGADGYYRLPGDDGRFPFMFSLRVHKPRQ